MINEFSLKEVFPNVSKNIPCHIIEDTILDNPPDLFKEVFPDADFSTYAFLMSGEHIDDAIFIRRSVYDDNSLKRVVLAHEYMHSIGHDEEEEADFEALLFLTAYSELDSLEKEQDMLIENWEVRHGRTFDEFMKE